MLYLKKIKTPVGEVSLIADETALVEVRHNFNPEGQDFKNGRGHKVIESVQDQLKLYFAGRLKKFNVPLSFLAGTPFQRKAWKALMTIPYGKTISYGDQAKQIKVPLAIRAVGAANGKNPIPIIVPCHRVIGASGALTGFGWGVDVKKYLLELEGVEIKKELKIRLDIRQTSFGITL